jgi:hypothetical protein
MMLPTIVSNRFCIAVGLHSLEQGTEIRRHARWLQTGSNGAPCIQDVLHRLVDIYWLIDITQILTYLSASFIIP